MASSPRDTQSVKDLSPPSPAQHVREHSGVKRAREGSLEPTPNPISTPLTTKKNRLGATSEQETEQESEEDPSPKSLDLKSASGSAIGSAPGTIKEKETNNVGEVRRKVQEMTYEEGQATTTEAGAAGEEDKDAKDLKRKSLDRNADSVQELGDAKKVKESPSPPREDENEPTPAPLPAKKPQSSFSAFSSSTSPFSASSSASKASPFATAPASASASASSSTKPTSSFGSAFGNYSSTSSPFARKPATTTTAAITPTAIVKEDEKEGTAGPSIPAEEDTSAKPAGSSFGDILKESKADQEDTGEKVQMTEKDVHTGEEGEETVYQCRAKLYVMQSDGGWKERGVGALRLNVRASDGKGARIVMRAEGVLRLMLNVSLYVGMTVLEDGKHVRSTVFEDNERRLVTFRLGSQKAASELCGNIQDHIPLESDTKSPAPASTPAPSSSSKPDTEAKGDDETPAWLKSDKEKEEETV